MLRSRLFLKIFLSYGLLLSVLLLVAPNDTADMTQLVGYARQQQTRIVNSALPPALTGANR